MADDAFGRFDDPAIEAKMQITGRTIRIPFVRVYAVLVMAIVLAYATVDPFFVDAANEIRINLLLLPVMVVLGGYFAATFWPRYPEYPMIDFAALLGLGMLITANNAALFDNLARLEIAMHAMGGINRLTVTAFAAVALAGRMRLFAIWMACDLAVFLTIVVPAQTVNIGLVYALMSYVAGALVMLTINYAIDRANRRAFALTMALDAERAKNEELLYNVLPPVAAQRLKDGLIVADAFSDASVVFIDVVGFSTLAKKISPGHLIEVLNAFFSLADRCAAETGVEKVKTIGDAYLAISGGNAPAANSADAAIAFGQAVIAGLPQVEAKTGVAIAVRIGIHSGPVVGGVIGATRMAYDYWGETMNIAARIEGTAEHDGIAISEATYLRTRAKAGFGDPIGILLKGVGETLVYRTRGRLKVIAAAA